MAPLTFVDTHNMVACLSKSDVSEGFDQIVDFLDAHTIQHALVVVISEDIIQRDLHLDDADGVECLPNEEIFKELARGEIKAIDADEDITLVDVEKDEEVVAMDASLRGGLIKKMLMLLARELVLLSQLYLMKKREDLVALWNLVKENFSLAVPSEDKEKALWVELKRLFEPDVDDVLWKLQRYMHAPLTRKLYIDCGVRHVSSIKGHGIFMLTEKDHPLLNGVMILMLSGK
nr:hypothetical protein [Tanacetum cinerariifolium]